MSYVIFEQDYDHVWPSRAVSAYKRGWKGRVKREIAEAAVPKFARKAKPEDEAPPMEPTLEGGLPADLAEPEALRPNRHVADETKTK